MEFLVIGSQDDAVSLPQFLLFMEDIPSGCGHGPPTTTLNLFLIEACIANERRATTGSPDPRAFRLESPNIGCAGINNLSVILPAFVPAR
jgi:hypothetical protein